MHHPKVGWGSPLHTMKPSEHRPVREATALGIAHAMLAGGPWAHELRARTQHACGTTAAWTHDLALAMEARFALSWPFLRAEALAEGILNEPSFFHPWIAQEPPRLVGYFLRNDRQLPPPFALEDLRLPALATTGDLAAWLGMELRTLDWLCAWPARRRKAVMFHQHYRWRVHSKPSGGVRLLAAPQAQLRCAQRQIHDGLLSQVPVHEAAMGFVRGRSVVQHARHHAGQAVVLKLDLRDFFGSVRASRVHAIFATLGYAPGVSRALTALLTCRTPEALIQRLLDDRLIDAEHALRLRDPHLPQGAPSSPALANLCAFGLDVRLAALARAMGARYSRYADDLALSCDSAMLLHRRDAVEAKVAAIVREESFALNHRKTRCATRAGAQRVCGVICNEHPNLPRVEFDKLKALLHQCARDGPAAHNAAGHADFEAQVRGRVAWACQVNPAKGARLARCLALIRWQG